MPPSRLVIAWNTINGNPLIGSSTRVAASAYRCDRPAPGP